MKENRRQSRQTPSPPPRTNSATNQPQLAQPGTTAAPAPVHPTPVQVVQPQQARLQGSPGASNAAQGKCPIP